MTQPLSLDVTLLPLDGAALVDLPSSAGAVRCKASIPTLRAGVSYPEGCSPNGSGSISQLPADEDTAGRPGGMNGGQGTQSDGASPVFSRGGDVEPFVSSWWGG